MISDVIKKGNALFLQHLNFILLYNVMVILKIQEESEFYVLC